MKPFGKKAVDTTTLVVLIIALSVILVLLFIVPRVLNTLLK